MRSNFHATGNAPEVIHPAILRRPHAVGHALAGAAARRRASERTLHRSSRLGLHVSQLYFAVGPKVSVNAIYPGIISTDLLRGLLGHREVELTAGIAMGRIGTPEDVASIVRYLAVEAHLFMTGHHFVVDGFQWCC